MTELLLFWKLLFTLHNAHTNVLSQLTHTHTHTQQELTSKPDNDVVLNVIDKDLDRTFPSHVLFQKSGSQGYGA